jgi:hypothetical protein
MYSKGSGRCRRQKWLDIYYCRSQHKGGSGCGAPKLSREVTDYSLNALISEMFLQPTVLGSLIEKALEPPERSPIDEIVAKAAMELERLKAEKQRLLSLTLQGVFSDEEVATEARRIDSEMRSWSALVSKDQQQKALRSAANVRETAQLIASVFAEYQFLSPKERKYLARQFVKRIEVEDKHFIAITLSLPASDAKIRTRMGAASNFGAGREVTLVLREPYPAYFPQAIEFAWHSGEAPLPDCRRLHRPRHQTRVVSIPAYTQKYPEFERDGKGRLFSIEDLRKLIEISEHLGVVRK